ncbi:MULTISPECIES: cation-translocating P-type ATPase [unclassified Enterococcus]|uniref:heavy metal translocating P-type ATPase n=1 Tax=unclassified Enterococcus TaxID=2608891 RepID=UPI0015552AE2|nr:MULTISPECIES: cation-translocating P-type ATPase [unclassified Enterococcus]MBS7577595.1 cadmium-translocating P-type ATPase [Enterococcus sp. MMGLQ5-2]MBS7584906.1 cadmium-translocating P-type ATPase [Enterococcus sp. MMGLQ5-1]NPD12761.1 cadmium-translocating P-type ATPase [Enterococcus sp. MMGLQ5-1]NPD37428.1 cadmium-translocating P-type ATPase [Enterococcus sp. MMGLQ5-2]
MNKQILLSRIDPKDIYRVIFTALIAGLVLTISMTQPSNKILIILLTAIGLIVGCWPIIMESWEDIQAKKMSMDLSMLIAIIAAASIGQGTTSLVITLFVLVAEILEDLCMAQGEASLSNLLAFLPQKVKIKQKDTAEITTVSLDDVSLNDIVIISPGDRIPVDGIVLTGFSTVNQARITGESMPVDVTKDDYIYAGSVNGNGILEVRADRIGPNSSYGQIISAVRDAQASKAPVQRLADKFAAYLVYTAVIGAILTWIITRNLHSAIDVIIVAGACGIAAGTPLALLASIARAANNGAFVKGGESMETLAKIDTVIFDKTGTLTNGNPKVVAIEGTGKFTEDELLQLAASAEWHSEHPLGKAIIASAQAQGLELIEPTYFENQPGIGLRSIVNEQQIEIGNATLINGASIDTESNHQHSIVVYIVINDQFSGKIYLTDEIRETSKEGIKSLKKLGLRVIMLTGDTKKTALEIAKALEIDKVYAQLMPVDKLAIIDKEKKQGHLVAMVGDGVNDAPALAQADVGIAMGSGTAIARESAKIILVSSKITDLTNLLVLSKRVNRILVFNFLGTLTIDIIGMCLAAFGFLTPISAALIHVISESIFILNSARLIPKPNWHHK